MKERKKIIITMVLIIGLTVAAAVAENQDVGVLNENGLERDDIGGDIREETVWYQIDGAEKKEIMLDVNPQTLSEDEANTLLANARQEWEKEWLGENESADHVDRNLNLPATVMNGLVSVTYEPDQPTVLNEDGSLQGENIPEEGILISLTSVFSYETYELTDVRSIMVFPPPQDAEELLEEKVKAAAALAEETDRENKHFILPQEVDGHAVTWETERNHYWILVLLLGTAALIALRARQAEEEKKKKKLREENLLYEYPQMLEQMCLLLGSGMTPRKAWERMVLTYQKQKEMRQIGERVSAEEMIITEREMRKGRGEKECYERFGRRIGLEPYRRFSAILTQNLVKGTSDVRRLLMEEAERALELRKNTARRLGEEASTKLLGPMLVMFLVILAAVMFPALDHF